MIVICIDDKDAYYGGNKTPGIVIGKYYKVEKPKLKSLSPSPDPKKINNPKYLYIVDDKNYARHYPSSNFLTLEEYRDKIIDDIL